jgi:hypothetical protein
MAPSGRNSKSAAAIAEIPDMNTTQLELILAKLTILATRTAKVAALEKLLIDSNAQKIARSRSPKSTRSLPHSQQVNSLEQYNFSWSVQLNNIQLLDGDRTDTYTVMQTVFDKALRPIFEGAKNCGLIFAILDCDNILETTHILPAKASDCPKPDNILETTHILPAKASDCPKPIIAIFNS